ncbi:MAG: PIN domain-containing protein [Deltaproteobacteria bacterium]|nr:PIN domain-containing protein [Deltaproteobacteria bacterium]
MIYIDTGAFLARYLGRDQYHQQAKAFWDAIDKKRESCFTSNFVLDETFTLLGRRAGYSFAAARAQNIYASKLLSILRPTRNDEIKAIEFLQKFAEHEVSFTDCISFVLMRRERIKRVFSFDTHFQWAGFKILP